MYTMHVFMYVCFCVSVTVSVFLAACVCGSGRNMWLTILLLRFKASLEQGHENKPASPRAVSRD